MTNYTLGDHPEAAMNEAVLEAQIAYGPVQLALHCCCLWSEVLPGPLNFPCHSSVVTEEGSAPPTLASVSTKTN